MGTGSKREYKECDLMRVEHYTGQRKPRCNGGDGCNRCWDKYNRVQDLKRALTQ